MCGNVEGQVCSGVCCSVLYRVAECCSVLCYVAAKGKIIFVCNVCVLQCAVSCCRVLQSIGVCCSMWKLGRTGLSSCARCVDLCIGLLYIVAVCCCSVLLQCVVAVCCCSVLLQCFVAVCCCSVLLQCVLVQFVVAVSSCARCVN